MWLDIERKDVGSLRQPTLIVAVSTSLPQYQGLYSQARELGRYMLDKLAFEQVATFYSSSLGPEVAVNDDGLASLPSCQVHLLRGRKDILLFVGSGSPMDDQYQFARALLQYAQDMGVEDLYSVGARWVDQPIPPESEPVPRGFATDEAGVRNLRKNGVEVVTDESAPFFASMVVGLAREYGIRGYKLSVDHGEPSPHPRSVGKLLSVLSKMAGFEISTEDLRPKAAHAPQQKPPGDDTIYH
jgi:proteasome assembly chaperone (PAC2) family protein